MDKIAIVGDAHFGWRADNSFIRSRVTKGQKDFYETLATELRDRGIDTIIFTGDIFTSRTQQSVDVIHTVHQTFKHTLKDFTCHIIAGNHDLYYENDYSISSLCIIEDLPNVKIYKDKVEKLNILDKTFYMVPWIIEENEQKFIKFLEQMAKKSNAEKQNVVIVGHFDMITINMEGSSVSVAGLNPHLFTDAAGLTISGHYHGPSTRETNGNRINYVGSPYQLTFANAGERHGYNILDTELNFEFVENKQSPVFFETTDVNERGKKEDLSNMFVKIHVDRGMSLEDQFALKSELESRKPITIQYIPYGEIEESNTETDKNSEEITKLDTIGLSKIYIDNNEEQLPPLNGEVDVKGVVLNKIEGYLETLKK